MFCRTFHCVPEEHLGATDVSRWVLRCASNLFPLTCLPTNFKNKSTKYLVVLHFQWCDWDNHSVWQTWKLSCWVFFLKKMPLPMLGPLFLWYFLVFLWNSFWISCHQISFWYSDHYIYFLIVVLSPAGRSWWFFVKSASYFATYSRSCMRSGYLALLFPRYWCCNYLFERENIDNIFLIISALSIIWSQN